MNGDNSARGPDAGSGPRDRSSLGALPAGLDRRFEAVTLWSTHSRISARTRQDLLALNEAGMAVAWVAPDSTANMAERLGGIAAGAPPFIVAGSDGSGAVAIDHSGADELEWPLPVVDSAILDRAADALSRRLAQLGIGTSSARRIAGLPTMNVELAWDPAVPLTRSSFKGYLHQHGIQSVCHLAGIAVEEARYVGIDEPRVVVEGHTVLIAVQDGGDAAVGVLHELWRRGVDPREVLAVVDGLAGVPRRPAQVVVPDVRDVAVVLVNGGRSPSPAGLVALSGGEARIHQLLADQLRRRTRRSLPEVATRAGWTVCIDGFDLERERVHEALLTLANGHVGMSGAPLGGHAGRHPWVVARGVYVGENAHSHLLTGPVAFALGELGGGTPLRRVLDLRTGVLHEQAGAEADTIESARFVSLAQPTTAVLRSRYRSALRSGPTLLPATDDVTYDVGRADGATWLRVAGSTGGIAAAAAQTLTRRSRSAEGSDAGSRVLDRIATYHSSPDTLPDPSHAVDAVAGAAAVGFDRLLSDHRRAWARRWEDADVVIEGDDELQLSVRFALFHLMASVADSGEAPVGARGLSGTGYGGHVFWDSDTFVLPFLAATHPEAARAMLEYRLRRLPAALEAARTMGRAGARFPWESAHTGLDVTPRSARDRSGRVVPIRTGQLEEHIVADVSWAACCYVDWSGDEEFARGPGLDILAETARYWASRIRVEVDGSAHIFGVVGPDEYHEPVDDNAYTNVMARWNLRRAAAAMEAADADAAVDERRTWAELADALVDGYDADTGIYKQFAGFDRLEPLIIAELAPHRPIAADLLLGAERTRGAQVIKQADVLMIHHLLPDEAVPGSLEPNLRYYEPRTAHGSSLSPAIHASLHARVRDFDRSLEALRIAARMDLDDLTGSTAEGLHLATMGGTWQAIAFGFMGLRPHAGMLRIDPVLPPSWSAIELRVRFRGSRVRVRKERARLTISADGLVSVVVGGTPYVTGSRDLQFQRHGPSWESLP
jgi:trehalose/maltose hydrolase-like predicted phosphorylase